MADEKIPQVRRPNTPKIPGVERHESGHFLIPEDLRKSSAGRPVAAGGGERRAGAAFQMDSRVSRIKPLAPMAPGADMRFKHFGVLNDGQQSKASVLTSGTVNVVLAIIICLLGLAARRVYQEKVLLTNLVAPDLMKKIEPKKEIIEKVKIPPPIEEPKLVIQQPKLETPRILVKKTELIKPEMPEMKMAAPAPSLPAPNLQVKTLAQPKALAINPADAPAKVVQVNPTKFTNLNDAINAGKNQRTAQAITFGNPGVPGGTKITRQVSTLGGLGGGPGGNGTGGEGGNGRGGRGVAAVSLGMPAAPPPPQQQRQVVSSDMTELKITSKLNPTCTAEAKQLHIEGQVFLNVNFTARGVVQVLGVARGLGHGLDQAAIAAAQQVRFEPEKVGGSPVDKKEVIAASFACGSQ